LNGKSRGFSHERHYRNPTVELPHAVSSQNSSAGGLKVEQVSRVVTRQLIPVEFHSVATTDRCEGVAVGDRKRFSKKPFETETMCFEERRVGDCGEKMYVQVVDAVRCDAKIVGFGETGNFDAATLAGNVVKQLFGQRP